MNTNNTLQEALFAMIRKTQEKFSTAGNILAYSP